jgi:hypothetical protein
MSPLRSVQPSSNAAASALARAVLAVGITIRDERLRRDWPLRILAAKAGLSVAAVHNVEAGRAASLDTYIRLADALGLRLELLLTDPRRRPAAGGHQRDVVHSAMGELGASKMGAYGFGVGIDEPYQHYQFAGRADVVAWDLDRSALLHLENLTRFNDLQATAGSWNAKRAYLPDQLAERLGVRGGWRSVTHVMVALWTAEVLHALRLRTASFRALCPDSAEAFIAWWAGDPPSTGTSSALIVLDPLATGRQRLFVDLDDALRADARHRGYAAVAEALQARGTARARGTPDFSRSVNSRAHQRLVSVPTRPSSRPRQAT